jgi:hypothetical protein
MANQTMGIQKATATADSAESAFTPGTGPVKKKTPEISSLAHHMQHEQPNTPTTTLISLFFSKISSTKLKTYSYLVLEPAFTMPTKQIRPLFTRAVAGRVPMCVDRLELVASRHEHPTNTIGPHAPRTLQIWDRHETCWYAHPSIFFSFVSSETTPNPVHRPDSRFTARHGSFPAVRGG